MHYGCKIATGQFMQTSYSLFFAELGLSFQPLQESYNRYGFLVTHSWMKTLWDKLSLFDMKVVVTEFAQEYPQQGNQFIMQVLQKVGYAAETLLRLNRVHISFQLLFMSDILTASGNKVNTEILLHHPLGEKCSNMRWPQERPTNSNLQSWKNAMLTICPSRCKSSSIGQFLGNTHRIWHWSWCMGDSTLRHLQKDGKMEEVFISGHKPNRFHYSHSQLHSRQCVICSVYPTLDGGHWRLLSIAPCADPYRPR